MYAEGFVNPAWIAAILIRSHSSRGIVTEIRCKVSSMRHVHHLSQLIHVMRVHHLLQMPQMRNVAYSPAATQSLYHSFSVSRRVAEPTRFSTYLWNASHFSRSVLFSSSTSLPSL